MNIFLKLIRYENKGINKPDYKFALRKERRLFSAVLLRLLLISNIAGLLNNDNKRVTQIKRFCKDYCNELFRLLFHHGLVGLKLFKDKVNYVIHYILLGKADFLVPRTFRLNRF
jgi:hypothetical protein